MPVWKITDSGSSIVKNKPLQLQLQNGLKIGLLFSFSRLVLGNRTVLDFASLHNSFQEKLKYSSSSMTRRTKMKKLLVSTRSTHSAIFVRRLACLLVCFRLIIYLERTLETSCDTSWLLHHVSVQSELAKMSWLSVFGIRPFPSSLLPLFQNESKCVTFHMKMSSACNFIFMQIKSLS